MTDISADNASRIAEGLCSHNAVDYPNTLEEFAAEGHDVIYALRAHIDALETRVAKLEAKFKRMALNCISAHGREMDACQAQIEAEAKLDEEADTIDNQAATIKALVEALGKLCFEVAGLQAFEQGVRHEIGNTNYSAIMTRLNDGGVAIAAAKETA